MKQLQPYKQLLTAQISNLFDLNMFEHEVAQCIEDAIQNAEYCAEYSLPDFDVDVEPQEIYAAFKLMELRLTELGYECNVSGNTIKIYL